MNPFTEILASFDSAAAVAAGEESTAEESLYARTREARQMAQHASLLHACTFIGDITLSRSLAKEAEDPRHSIIFIARPPQALLSLPALQSRITQILSRHGVTQVWSTPQTALHITLLDVVSCVTQDVVHNLLPLIQPREIIHAVRQHQDNGKDDDGDTCRLSRPSLMVDASAIALTFLPHGHLLMRQALWDGCCAAQVVPRMRYVANSAHMTLIRFLDTVTLSREAMANVLGELEALDLSEISDWTITKNDIACTYGQVYYGQGHVLS